MHAAVELEKHLQRPRGRLPLQPVELRRMVQHRPQIQFGAGGDFIRAKQAFEQQDRLVHPHQAQVGGFFQRQHGKPVRGCQRAPCS